MNIMLLWACSCLFDIKAINMSTQENLPTPCVSSNGEGAAPIRVCGACLALEQLERGSNKTVPQVSYTHTCRNSILALQCLLIRALA